LAYLRKKEHLAVNKNESKVQNGSIDSAEQYKQFTMNLL
jgi:hypothetical protein